MQMCRTWLCDRLPTACLERRVYEDAISQTDLLLVEDWLSTEEMYASLATEEFRALIGAIKVLRTLVNVCISETTVVEGIRGASGRGGDRRTQHGDVDEEPKSRDHCSLEK